MSFRNLVAAVCLLIFASTSVVYAQEAVLWKIEDGGNGHWYSVVPSEIDWNQCRIESQSLGGDLATITSSQENMFVFDLALGMPGAWVSQYGPFVGGYRDLDGNYAWVSGEDFEFSMWGPSEPNNDSGGSGPEEYIALLDRKETWNDVTFDGCGGQSCSFRTSGGYVVEWSTDCNGDGLVDYGQILSGDLEDLNADGVPDECQVCEADLDGNGQLDFFDISGFLVFYQLGDSTADFTGDGQLNFFDVSAFLNAFNAGCP